MGPFQCEYCFDIVTHCACNSAYISRVTNMHMFVMTGVALCSKETGISCVAMRGFANG
jgi:hypothetical protein